MSYQILVLCYAVVVYKSILIQFSMFFKEEMAFRHNELYR